MKKKIFVISSVLLLLVASYYNYPEKRVADSLLLENIEALAVGESGVPVHCVDWGTVDCPIKKVKVRMVASGYNL